MIPRHLFLSSASDTVPGGSRNYERRKPLQKEGRTQEGWMLGPKGWMRGIREEMSISLSVHRPIFLTHFGICHFYGSFFLNTSLPFAGAKLSPSLPSRETGTPGSGKNSNCCKTATKTMKSSTLASCSPRQALLPVTVREQKFTSDYIIWNYLVKGLGLFQISER